MGKFAEGKMGLVFCNHEKNLVPKIENKLAHSAGFSLSGVEEVWRIPVFLVIVTQSPRGKYVSRW